MMKRLGYGLVLCLTLVLVACQGKEPDTQLIASYPTVKQLEVYPVPPPGLVVVYNANLEIEVQNVDRAAEKARDIAFEYNGYLASSQSWYQEGEPHITLVLAVPVVYFDTVHRALLRLGDLVSERVTGDLKAPGQGEYEWGTFSHITLNLRPKDRFFPSLSLPDWRPVSTFSKAWRVAGAIFGFLLDVIIWVGVVAGPFVLAGWVVTVLVRRRKGKLVDKVEVDPPETP
jgi:hypothetical protein